jgi:prepilin-type N-terminal cleavage/methylation domain-containing protein/prepilin-type processing-associated H-X9-DG protein
MKHSPPAGGFTLIELLTVVAVIAILIGLTVPVVTHVKQSGWATRSSSNLRQLAVANMAYLSDHGCYAPADDRWNLKRWHGSRSGTNEPFDPASGYLADYLGNSRRVTPCPLFTAMLSKAGEDTFEAGTGGYGYNASYVGGTPGWAWNADGSRVSATPARVPRLASTVMFATTAYARSEGIQEYPYAEPPFWDFGEGPTFWRPSPSVHFRFRGKAIVAWCDGHVSMETREERDVGYNPHGGDPADHGLGWFGPDEENGYWNPQRQTAR